jgi:hypothetical protein
MNLSPLIYLTGKFPLADERDVTLIDFATSKYSLRASMKTNNLSQRGKW